MKNQNSPRVFISLAHANSCLVRERHTIQEIRTMVRNNEIEIRPQKPHEKTSPLGEVFQP